MADAAIPQIRVGAEERPRAARHSGLVRATHWITAACFVALLVSGVQIVISHPRFYWGDTGNVRTPALLQLPIPASRPAVNTGYDFVLPDQNGWSRSLHFQAAWVVVFTGLLYLISGVTSGHFRRNLMPTRQQLATLTGTVADHLRFRKPDDSGEYNVLQRLAYLGVVFVLFPLMIWTGLAMSPGVVSAFPAIVEVLGGHQSARTLHFGLTLLLVLFVIVHLAMVVRAGFLTRVRAMITGGKEQS